MTPEQHAANRAWAFQALDDLEGFIEDADFEGDAVEEGTGIERKRTELREGKYRVVFLGAFNVGKSLLINALLGDEYLPTVLEECTAKTTHILRGADARCVLRLVEELTEDEFRTLEQLIGATGIRARITRDDERREVTIGYLGRSPREILNSLKALVTMNAEEEFPQLKSVRAKFDEVMLYLPSEFLEEDIAFVDSPGVHSITETTKMVVQDIIPNSHLVIYLIDSQTAGNEQSRDFIERVVQQRRRKMFFVISKSDQLNREEIDPRGRRGPAKDLLRSLRGVVEDPEIFFLSSLYALVGTQLSRGRLDLADLDANNKIKIPFGIQMELFQSGEPRQGVADYLIARSNLALFRTRLLDYLYKENREGAIVESACRFVEARSWAYARPLEIKLELARNMPRLAELAREREELTAGLEDRRGRAERIVNAYEAMSRGGHHEGRDYEGYEAVAGSLFTEEAIERSVVAPLRQWIADPENLKKARKLIFEPLRSEVETTLDAFGQSAQAAVNEAVNAAESTALGMGGDTLRDVSGEPRTPVAIPKGLVEAVHGGMGKSYLAFGALGAAVGACAGAAAGATTAGTTFMPSLGVNPGIVAGAAAAGCALVGLIVRRATSKSALTRRLNRAVKDQVARFLLRGTREGAPGQVLPVRDQLKADLDKRRAEFIASVRVAFDNTLLGLREKLEAVLEEEEQLLREQRAIIERLEPKRQRLMGLGGHAQEIVHATAPKQTADAM